MDNEKRQGERRGKSPAFQFYAKDWLVDTAYLSLEEQGAYIRLLSHQWVNGGLPRLAADRARLLRVPVEEFRRIWKRLGIHFPRGRNPRLERIRVDLEAYRARQAQAGQRGADRRWHGAANGEPIATPMAKPMAKNRSASASALKDNTDGDRLYLDDGRDGPGMIVAQEDTWGKGRGKR